MTERERRACHGVTQWRRDIRRRLKEERKVAIAGASTMCRLEGISLAFERALRSLRSPRR